MDTNNKQLKSILGKWWEPLRKWFYPAWLIYEISIRFYNYAQSVHSYVLEKQNYSIPYIEEIGSETLAFFCSISTFTICTIFLTVPTSFVLYEFFKTENLTDTLFEKKMKPIF